MMTFEMTIEPDDAHGSTEVVAMPAWSVVVEVNAEGEERHFVVLTLAGHRLWLDRRGRPTTLWGRRRYRSRVKAERVRQRFSHRYYRFHWIE